ncbi:hypothetical protein WHI96_07985 [Pseudonocardia tropica]|uniref:Uncharacterized protein n=1 Tax=Pseudonocardia tropica TaxID=681289 RepID=A0ABV1JUD3_9PSEU
MLVNVMALLLAAATPTPAETTGGVDLQTVLTLLLGAGGSGALAGLIALYRTWKKGKLEDEETLIARLNSDSKSQGDRADAAEQRLAEAREDHDRVAGELRRQRDEAREDVAWYRSFLIQHGYDLDPIQGRPAHPQQGQHRGQ